MPSKTEAPIIHVSRKVYETSLSVYPKDLRSQFGEEMVEVFGQQISDAYSQVGSAGVIRVWSCAVRELVTIALAGQVADRIVPLLGAASALGFMLWFGGYIADVMAKACGSCGH